MKLRYLYIILIAISAFSCSDWLDLQPSDTVSSDNMFEEGNGYRIVLNGIYKQASSAQLYGRELTWGMLSACGEDYAYGSNGLSYYHAYYTIAKSHNYTHKEALDILDPIWKTAYKCIANCNYLLGEIRNEEPALFAFGSVEKDLIMGEAQALRAMLHFDILRLYAPAKDDGEVYVPYYEQDGLSKGEPAIKVNEVLEKVIKDLTEAQALVVAYDTLDQDRQIMLSDSYRFKTTFYSNISAAERESFFSARAYRLNYLAVTALLARVYNYMGEHKKANEKVQEILDYKISDSYGNPFAFSTNVEVAADLKTTKDIIFCLSDPQLYTNYEPYTKYGNSTFMVISSAAINNFDDISDYRSKVQIGVGDNTQKISLKYVKPLTETSETRVNADILPIIRLSELYYIKAEYEASEGRYSDAAATMDIVRMGRNCTAGRLSIADQASFEKELLKEARREFISEGQTYFFYKKLGVVLNSSMKPEHFVFPKPIDEDVQI